ncbi:iron dicitrate transporter FecR [Spirochaetia bacterium]|nr:iron dicitrate transporter FecR [Spirochaetia bacterium]
MKRFFNILVIVMLTSSGTLLFAQANNTVFKTVTGTVEVKAPGSSSWITAWAGMVIENNTSISTGFKSTALLSVGNSVITVLPITRLTLEEIIANGANEQVGLYLHTGRIRAEVTPPAGGRTEFAVRSPSVTASVRGTVFEFDTVNLNVIAGRVLYSSNAGSLALVRGGEQSTINETSSTVTAPREIAAAAFSPELPAGAHSGTPGQHGPIGPIGPTGPTGPTDNVKITGHWAE